MKNRQAFIFIPSEKRGFLAGLTGFFVLIFMCLLNGNLSAANLRDVVINEIAWMGTAASTYDEWIELYNNTGSTVNLTNWTLTAADGTPSITLSGSVAPYGYFLLERTDNNTVSDIAADQIYSGSTENGDEDFQLKDSSDTLIDQVDCSSGWFAGDNTNKITMERINPEIDGSTST
ncbi:MAG: lamin tail domain-containing protein, partial [Elusimicrobia bacterium]|nr:lamin tail domain-containing protein [Elusimicrobiota bacterium]